MLLVNLDKKTKKPNNKIKNPQTNKQTIDRRGAELKGSHDHVLPVLTQCQVTGAGTSSLRPVFILAEPKLGEEEPSHIAGYVSLQCWPC